MSKTLQGHHTK